MKIYKIGLLLIAFLLQLIVFSDGLVADCYHSDIVFYDEWVVDDCPDSQKQQNCKVLYTRNYFSNPVYVSSQFIITFKLLVEHEKLYSKWCDLAQQKRLTQTLLSLLPRSFLSSSTDELKV